MTGESLGQLTDSLFVQLDKIGPMQPNLVNSNLGLGIFFVICFNEWYLVTVPKLETKKTEENKEMGTRPI